MIDILRNRPTPVRERLANAVPAGVAISSVVLFELWHGVARNAWRAENAERLRRFLAGPVGVVAFGGPEAVLAGELRAVLENEGRTIGPYDLLIAAQARQAGATLVTGNLREFQRVEGLNCEDWSRRR